MMGEPQRTISSTPVGAIPAGSACHRARWSGCSAKASRPLLMALRVVSFPAMTKRMKKDATSAGESDSPSMLLWTRAEVTSSVGSLRRASASSDMSVVSCLRSLHQRHQGIGIGGEILRVP
jgi:hypothetical protein